MDDLHQQRIDDLVYENDGLVESLDELEGRLWKLENSRFMRLVRWPGRVALRCKTRLGQVLLHSPVYPLYSKLWLSRVPDRAYQAWVEREQRATPAREWFERHAAEFARRPLCSVVMPVRNPRREWLEAAIDSVRRQFYANWELCICDDASDVPWMAECLEQAARGDARIRYVRAEARQGIAGALNRAAELATGEYLAFLDHDDVLAPQALYYVAGALDRADADLIYSDEDRLDEAGRRVEPIFKPAWSPALLLSCMYMGHLLVVKRSRFVEAGRFRSEMDGSQDHDLVLRLTDGPANVRHIPRVLYHWRKHRGSTAASPRAKPIAQAAGRRAVEDTMKRRGIDATVEDGEYPNTYRVRRSAARAGKASVVICSRNEDLARRCLDGIERQTEYGDYEVILVEHGTNIRVDGRCRKIHYEGEFNFSQMNNLGAREAQGDWLVFLNDDVTPLRRNWLGDLAGHVAREEVGVVGAKLLYPSGAIQHAGIVTGMTGGARHPGRDTYGSPYWSWLGMTRNVSAVTGACMAIRKSVFEELGGWDEEFPVNFNDVDLCIRARARGYEVIYEAGAVLRHEECQTRPPGVRWRERQRWRMKWPDLRMGEDPYYSPHLSVEREDASLRGVEPMGAEERSR